MGSGRKGDGDQGNCRKPVHCWCVMVLWSSCQTTPPDLHEIMLQKRAFVTVLWPRNMGAAEFQHSCKL